MSDTDNDLKINIMKDLQRHLRRKYKIIDCLFNVKVEKN